MQETLPRPLFSTEFPPATTEEWMAVVEKDLKGADFEKRLVWTTDDGIAVRPFHRKEDLPTEAWVRKAAPGGAPYLRGYGHDSRSWAVRDVIRTESVADANLAARHSLMRGADQVQFRIYPYGIALRTAADMKALLAGIDLESTPVFFAAGPLAPQVLALFLNEAESQGIPAGRLRGGVDGDPIVDGCLGWRDGGADGWEREATPLVAYDASALPLIRTLAVRAVAFHEAGATAAQELAYGLAVLVEYLAHLRGRNLSPERVVAQAEIQFGAGSNYLLEIAKLRAARVLISKVLEAFGVHDVRPRIHADTSLVTKTVYDAHANLLRATTEAMAAVIGGVDSLAVWPFDELLTPANEFSAHLARNVSLLLREEAYLGKVADPLGGGYTIEALTSALAGKAWSLFQEIEGNGGFVASWKGSQIPSTLAASRGARQKAAHGRRASIIGTNAYPNPKETVLGALRAPDTRPMVALSAFATSDSFTGVREALAEGSSLDNWLTATVAPHSPLDPFRPAEAFEAMRLRVERHVQGGGRRPTVQLVLAGDAKMRKARATFCTGFFGCGGFAVADDRPVKDVATVEPTGDLIVLCSSDAEYVDLATALRPRLGDKPLVIAGYPQDALPALEALGVKDFVHIHQDAVAVLTAYLDRLGIPA